MLELNIIVGGSTSPSSIGALPDRLAIEHGLRLVQVDLRDAASSSPAI